MIYIVIAFGIFNMSTLANRMSWRKTAMGTRKKIVVTSADPVDALILTLGLKDKNGPKKKLYYSMAS
jgi:hypothetical protein